LSANHEVGRAIAVNIGVDQCIERVRATAQGDAHGRSKVAGTIVIDDQQ
jgi:hypothetical protein